MKNFLGVFAILGLCTVFAIVMLLIERKRGATQHETPLTWNERINLMTAEDSVDTIFSHNEIVALWEKHENEEGHPYYMIWKGMGWAIPEQYKEMRFVRIFGTIPDDFMDSGNVNILVSPCEGGQKV